MDTSELQDRTHERLHQDQQDHLLDSPSPTEQATDSTVAKWREELARIATRLEALNNRSAAESRHLQRCLTHEITEMRAALRRLDAEIAAVDPIASAQRIAARLEDLQTQSNAAYVRLQASLAARPSHDEPLPRDATVAPD
jgi:hypothetical protein